MRSLVVKLVVGAALLVGLGVLFVRSLQSTRSEPYVVDGVRLEGWTLALERPSESAAPVLVLRGPPELVSGLFRQVFTRMMESLNSPAGSSIPIVLRGEYERALAGALDLDALVDAARDAGLEAGPWTPHCMAHRRISQPGATRQVYFAVFESRPFEQFRRALAARAQAAPAASAFDPAALSPVMFVASSDAGFHRWLPLRVDAGADCVAPLEIR